MSAQDGIDHLAAILLPNRVRTMALDSTERAKRLIRDLTLDEYDDLLDALKDRIASAADALSDIQYLDERVRQLARSRATSALPSPASPVVEETPSDGAKS